jgi:hypothetical protein
MMRLVLTPKHMEGIKEKLLKMRDKKSGQKYIQNHENKKYYSSR